MTLSLNWTGVTYNVSDTPRIILADIFTNIMSTLTHWTPLAGLTFDKSVLGDGAAGLMFKRNSDNQQFGIYYHHDSAPLDLFAGGAPNADNIEGSLFSDPDVLRVIYDINNSMNTKASILGANSIKAIWTNTATLVGVFERGETITIDGTYIATLVEYDPATGYMMITDWSAAPTPASAHTQLSNKAVVGGTSGATVNTHAFSASTSNFVQQAAINHIFGVNDTYYLENIVNGPPAGTVTGSTSGNTATVSNYTGSIGRLIVTGAKCRYKVGETITWAGGGSATVVYVPYAMTRAAGNLRMISQTAVGANKLLYGEDADHLAFLIPNVAQNCYYVILFGKWFESLEGRGLIDGAFCFNAFDYNQPYLVRGIGQDQGGDFLEMGDRTDAQNYTIQQAGNIGALQQTAGEERWLYKSESNSAFRISIKRNVRPVFGEDGSNFRLMAQAPYMFWTPAQNWKTVLDPDGSSPYGICLNNQGLCLDYTGAATP